MGLVVLGQSAEGRSDLGVEFLELSGDVLNAKAGVDELHARELGADVRGLGADGVPLELVFSGSLDGLLSEVVVRAEVAHHPGSLLERAVLLEGRESVLLEEVLTKQASNLEGDLISFSEGILTNELDNLGQLVLLLQDLRESVTKRDEVGVEGLVVGLEDLEVARVRPEPVDGGEVLTLSKTLLETPEDLDDVKSLSSDGLREVTSRGRDGTDDGDRTEALRGTNATNLTGTLVESGKTGSQVGRVTSFGGHLGETTRDLTKSLGPARGRIGHHGNVQTLIAEVLSKGDTSVDGSLASSDGHVGGVGDERGTLHDGLLATVNLDRQGGELFEYLSHLISALTTTDVDDDVRVGVLGQGLRNDSLSAAEGTGDGGGSSLHDGEESIQDTLASQERVVSQELLSDGARLTNGPDLHHGVVSCLSVVLDGDDLLDDGEVSFRRDPSDATVSLQGDQDSVSNQRVLVYGTENVSSSDHITDLEARRDETPLLLAIQRVDTHTLGDVDRPSHGVDGIEGTQDTVEDVIEDS